MLQTLIANLERASSLYASLPAFKIPIFQEDVITGYMEITYAKLYQDVLDNARYWSQVLQKDGVQQKSVVGLYVHGMKYTDVVHLYGIMRAGYIPQLINRSIYAADVISHLVLKSDARALVYDPDGAKIPHIGASNVKLYVLPPSIPVSNGQDDQALQDTPPSDANDVALILHTGGTSSIPKLVRMSYRLLDTILKKVKLLYTPFSKDNDKRYEVDSWIGSICHIGFATLLTGRWYHGTCTIQQTSGFPPRSEIISMVRLGHLSRASMFPVLLSRCIQDARDDTEFLNLMRNLDGIITGGVPPPRELENWAWENGINLINVYGSTESGIPMLIGGWRGGVVETKHPQLLVHFPLNADDGTPLLVYDFRSVDNSQLKEFIVLPQSADIPTDTASDGCYYTGDLFEEFAGESGVYVCKGRDADWIKMSSGLKVDCTTLENIAYQTCSDLIFGCVIIGTGKPSPALVVEPHSFTASGDQESLRNEIFQRISTSDIHAKGLSWEKIASPEMIIVVEEGWLPRTAVKGNVRRVVAEERLRWKLDQIWASTPV
ncbi:amp- ligase [Moniliophthora roreri MCA 2997]|uniref:Amp-ligase n=1 Tax=Moniliophthora roreri (strain MCA 2997) TaxID=1381753 RepID=V2Y3R4_MONRO|nr:amp- ligase [Moniliophthora roreri MCA 2997]